MGASVCGGVDGHRGGSIAMVFHSAASTARWVVVCLLAVAVSIFSAQLLAGETKVHAVIKTSRQFGTERLDFEVDGYRAMLLKPIRPAPGGARPWIFVAPVFMGPNRERPELNPYLFNHPIADDTPIYPPADRPDRGSHQKLFQRLLESGFYIGGIEVGDTMGNTAGRAHFTAYYKAMVAEYRLDPKPCMFGTSRGGLMIYNWAADHPEWVRCIGANQPVIDLALFPGLPRAADIFGLPLDEFLRTYHQHNPIDRLEPLAEHKIPILHVIGEADALLPVANMMAMQRRYLALGGQMQTFVIDGIPHGLWPELLSDMRFHDFFVAQNGLDKK